MPKKLTTILKWGAFVVALQIGAIIASMFSPTVKMILQGGN